jgi:hypothetical protein
VGVIDAGRKPLTETDPTLLEDLERLVDGESRGDPEGPLRWTAKSLRNLASELQAQGHQVSTVLAIRPACLTLPPCSAIATSQKSRRTSIPMNRMFSASSTLGGRPRASDNDGFVLAAHPDKSQG